MQQRGRSAANKADKKDEAAHAKDERLQGDVQVKRKKPAGKKGNADMILILVTGFVAIILLFVVHYAWRSVQDPVLGMVDGNEVGVDSMRRANSVMDSFDIVMVVVLIMLIVVTIVFAFMINTHPALFFIALLTLLVVGLLAIKFSNIFEDMSSDPMFANETATYKASVHVMSNYPKFMVIAFFLVAIVLYAKFAGGRQQQL